MLPLPPSGCCILAGEAALVEPGGGAPATASPTPTRCGRLESSQPRELLCRPPGSSQGSSAGSFGFWFLLELGVEGSWGGGRHGAGSGFGVRPLRDVAPLQHPHPSKPLLGQWGEAWSCFSLLPLPRPLPLYPCHSPSILQGLGLSPRRSLLSPQQARAHR